MQKFNTIGTGSVFSANFCFTYNEPVSKAPDPFGLQKKCQTYIKKSSGVKNYFHTSFISNTYIIILIKGIYYKKRLTSFAKSFEPIHNVLASDERAD